jgi:hypothetical protein
MRGRALPFVVLLLLSGAAEAQMTWQPTQPPLVTADNETWYRAGDAIEWNGALYYPAGVPEAFNRYQMVRSGSYRGIPLYTDATLEPYSIVFVPIAGGRMQPYERPRTGMLAGSVGSRMSAFPIPPSTESAAALTMTNEGFVTQAPAPPTFARAYDLGPEPAQPAVVSMPAPVATSGMASTVPSPAGTSGRVTAVTNSAMTAARPQGINGIWFDWNARRWISSGPAVELTGDYISIGAYRNSPVYQRVGDSLTIYIPSSDALVVPFRPRSR